MRKNQSSLAIVACFALFFSACPLPGLCQPGIQEFYSVSGEMNRWYYSLSDLVLVIGAVSGILGGLRIYANWQSGKHHIDSQVMGWFFSCLFLSIIGAVLQALYGVH